MSRSSSVVLLALAASVGASCRTSLPYEKDPLPVIERYPARVKDTCSSWLHSHITGFSYCASPKVDLALDGPQRKGPAGAGAAPSASGTASASTAPAFSKADGPTDMDSMMKHGEEIYSNVCVACHGPAGAGIPGAFPPLAGSGSFYGDAKHHATIITHGLTGEITVQGATFNGAMPAQGAVLTNYDIAAIATYERNSWGNSDGVVTPEDVASIRLTEAPPSGAPGPYSRQMVIGTWIVSLALGIPVGIFFLYPDEWALWRRIAVGLLLGVGTALILTANRLLGRSESI